MRIFEETVLKRLLNSARRRAHYAGEQPNASVEGHERRGFSAGKDDVPDGYLFDLGIGIEQAFIEALKAPADEGDARALRESADAGLGDGGAARGEGEDGGRDIRRSRSG